MQSPKRWAIAAAGLLAVSALAWVVVAGPVLPASRRLPDEVRCLADLKKVQVHVPPFIGLPKDMAVTRDVMRQWVVDRLTAADIEVSDEDDLPRVVLKLNIASDPKHPDTLGLNVIIGVHQKVFVERLDQTMIVPTATVSTVMLSTQADTPKDLAEIVRRLAGGLVEVIHSATTQRRLEGKPAGSE